MKEAKAIGFSRNTKRILNVTLGIAIVVFLVMTAMGKTLGSYEIRVMNLCAIYTVLGLSMNLINGFTGQFSLGQAGFMAIGAYTTTLLSMSPALKERVFYLEPIVPFLKDVDISFFVAIILGGLMAAFFAFLIGFPVLRLRGDYLAIATLGFSEIIRVVLTNTQSLTNGSTGINNISNNSISRLKETGEFVINGRGSEFEPFMPQANTLWCFGVMFLTVLLMYRIMKTSYGRAFLAIREDEIAAESMGISLFKHKMMSFVISGFIAGLGGGLMAAVVGAINPLLFRFILAYDILLIVVLGGMGSISGTIVSAFIITIGKEWLRWMDKGFSLGFVEVPPIDGMRMVVFSVLLMAVILFFRKGLLGGREFSWDMPFEFIEWCKKKSKKITKPKEVA